MGTIDRWNDGKKAEERERVKHGLLGQYTQAEKSVIECAKQMQIVENEGNEYNKNA